MHTPATEIARLALYLFVVVQGHADLIIGKVIRNISILKISMRTLNEGCDMLIVREKTVWQVGRARVPTRTVTSVCVLGSPTHRALSML